MESDASLMFRTQQGDQEAFNEIVLRHQNALVNFFYKLVWNRHTAEDFAQDVFVKVYLARANYRKTAKFTTYLFRIATNYWIDYLRTKGRHKKPLSLSHSMGTSDTDSDFASIIDSGELSPGELILRKEQLHRIRLAIEELPEEQKLVFLLSEIEDMKYKEISEVLDIPLGTVKSRIHTAVAKLRQALISKGVV